MGMQRRGPGRAHWRVVIDGNVYMFSNLLHAVPVLRELGVGVSASRLYNEYRDQLERARGLPVTSRTVVLCPRVSVSKA
jgi:hypothetical protein|eukprot:COSAG06_NODE_705_length_12906_cov_3.214414_3_plen_79_part_00